MELNIFNALVKYNSTRPKRFHMPGHKGDKKFNKMFRQARIDITELAFSDNLDNPCGVIEKAETEIAEILGAKKSFILTDGSSCGIFSMLKAVKPLGKKIIICRNSHRSVFNACEILDIEPFILNHNTKHGVVLPPSAEEIETLIKRDSEIIGVLLTSPDYFGNVPELAKIKEITTQNNKLLLIDGAHGSHLKFTDEEYYAGTFADIWVDGLHKTMPALTQGALVSTSLDKLKEPLANAVKYFRTTSPSYPIMASVEYAVKYMFESGAEYTELLRGKISDFKQKLLVKNYNFFKSPDYFKLAVDFKHTTISSDIAEKYLISKGIYPELNDGRYILFYLSPMTKKSELAALEKALRKLLKIKKFKNTFKDKPDLKTGKKSFSYLVAADMQKVLCPLEKSEGKICGVNAGIFPPCYPIVVAGETVTKEAIDLLKTQKNVFGLNKNCIYVIK